MTIWILVDQQMPITNAIIKLTNSPRGSSLVQRRPHGGNTLDDGAMVF